jgi:hypothetical protein
MNETKRGMFSGSSSKGGGKKIGMKMLKGVGYFINTTTEGFKEIRRQK